MLGACINGAGRGIFATRSFKEGEVVIELNSTTLYKTVYPTLASLATALETVDAAEAADILEHAIPGLSGKVY